MATVTTSRCRDVSVLTWTFFLASVVAADNVLSSWNKGP